MSVDFVKAHDLLIQFFVFKMKHIFSLVKACFCCRAFPIQLENGHVIEDYQVFVASMMVGVGGKKLEADYKSRSDENKVAELGRTVLEILRLSPGGALVFFPSYSAMNQYFTMWQVSVYYYLIFSVFFLLNKATAVLFASLSSGWAPTKQ